MAFSMHPSMAFGSGFLLFFHLVVAQSQSTVNPDSLKSLHHRKFRLHLILWYSSLMIWCLWFHGRTDVGYCEGNLQTPTPNIDRLANEGVIMDRYYTSAICTPSRAAFMSGKYEMAYSAIRGGEPWGLPADLKLLPAFLKDLNYTTSFLGKVAHGPKQCLAELYTETDIGSWFQWHLGAHTRAFLPDHRGFDYSLGIHQGSTNAFNYTTGAGSSPLARPYQSGRDLYENGRQVPVNHTNNH
ncbi:hypothetical protein RvY_04429 [Ramazzottius varieornatus]|uniref:Sulfatase N-terminal domain-containing protein n=1 Tax=Ramazzottius varieornatus TaxID=947166 RepID=A0A1D1UV60_RAMVA|nr:hypothetical protein RvY_04429 [Ramazzottius varieornatus]